MAITKNGRRIGRAAATERREQLEYIEDTWRKERRLAIEKAKEDFNAALANLAEVDPNWEEWYDDDENIPPIITWSNRAQIDELIRKMNERAMNIGICVSLVYGDFDLGTRTMISGGEVLELPIKITSGGDDMPF